MLKDDKGDDEPVSDIKLCEAADDARLMLELKALKDMGDAFLGCTRERHGWWCEYWKNCLVSLGAGRRKAGSGEAIGALYSAGEFEIDTQS